MWGHILQEYLYRGGRVAIWCKYIEFERCNEDNDIEGVVKKLESEKYEVRYATALIELDGGQKLVRFYDPSGNLIEIRTPWDKFGNRE